MRKLILFVSITVGLFGLQAFGTDLWGSLSGTLGPGNYNVIGSISVDIGDSLILLPGTTLTFSGDFYFYIFGYIYAVGTEEDSIKFLKNPTSTNWNGLDFYPTSPDESTLQYCYIEESDAVGIDISGCSPSILNCTLKSCNDGCG